MKTFFLLIFSTFVAYAEVKDPDPTLNNATLLGIDTDKNGVRDDIQVWIIQNFKDSPEIIQAFNNLASEMQETLQLINNRDESNRALMEALKAHMCLMHTMIDKGFDRPKARKYLSYFRAMQANTKMRIQAEILRDRNFHGQTVDSLSKAEACKR